MRRLATVLAALALSSVPLAAQEGATAQAAPTPAPAVEAPAQAERPAPSLAVSTEKIREDIRQADEKRGQADVAAERRMTSRDMLFLAGAVALGIIVAALLLD